MKRILLALALLAAPIALHAAAKPSDTLKLNLPKTQDLIKALLALDGSTRLDKDNAQVQVGYSFPAATRIAVSPTRPRRPTRRRRRSTTSSPPTPRSR